MKTYNLELRNIKIANHLSEETIAFTANLFCDGKLVAHCQNSGQGGPTNIQATATTIKTVMELDTYCKTLPPVDLGEYGSIPNNLEHVVDDLLEKHIEKKEQEKINRLMVNSIVIGDKGGYVYVKLQQPLSFYLSEKFSKDALKNTIQKHLTEVRKKHPDFMLLNTNIPDDLVRQLQVN